MCCGIPEPEQCGYVLTVTRTGREPAQGGGGGGEQPSWLEPPKPSCYPHQMPMVLSPLKAGFLGRGEIYFYFQELQSNLESEAEGCYVNLI